MGRRPSLTVRAGCLCPLGRPPASYLFVPLNCPRSHLQLLTPTWRETELGLRSRFCRICPQSSRFGVSALQRFLATLQA